MNFKNALLLSTTFLLWTTPQTLAQNKGDAALTKEFRQGFERGCNQGKTPGVKNQRKYCTCLGNSYQARYSGVQLTAISQIAGQTGDKGSALVNIMMAPEAQACTAKY